MNTLLVNTPTGAQALVSIEAGGAYFDPSRVLWDERTDGPLPDITLGGMVREGNALVFSQTRKDRIMGRLLMPVIDALFFWQEQDDEVNAIAGEVVRSHCRRAYYKEILRRSLPPEYRELEKE